MPSEQPENTVLGVVLAGGLSRRMGRDKAMLDYHGKTLLRHQVDVLTPLCGRVLVSGEHAGFDCVPDEGGRRGPLGGIHAVCRRFPGMAMLVIPVDMPQVTPMALAELLERRGPCHFDSQPLPAFFPDGGLLAHALQGIFGQPEAGRSIRRLHAALASQALDGTGFDALNVNTPEQWTALMQSGN